MTYAISWPLQEGLYALMCTDPACMEQLGARVFDAPPPAASAETPDEIYMTFGDETVTDWSTATGGGARHDVTVTIHAPRSGFADAKRAAGAVSDAILGGALSLSRGTVVNTRFIDARTRRRDDDGLRQIDLRFRITVED